VQDNSDETPQWVNEIARECSATNLQRFIRDNFGLYQPPGDHRALREENLRRTAAAALRRVSR
jgi:hypothetical protein